MSTHIFQSRKMIESQIEELICLLDLMDGDCDFEPDNDNEPSLGWPSNGPSALAAGSGHDDREVEDENDEDGRDDEPSLGWNLSGFMGTTFDPDLEFDDSEHELNGDEGDHSDDPQEADKHYSSTISNKSS